MDLPRGHRRSLVAIFGDLTLVKETLTFTSSQAPLPALTTMAIAPGAAEMRPRMQIRSSVGSKIRKWLGLDKKPAGKLQGTGA